jgi:hypothetical protein
LARMAFFMSSVICSFRLMRGSKWGRDGEV